jgi:hypothetical protein
VGRDKRSKNACVGDACGDGLSSDAGVVACLEADALVGRDRRSKDSVAFDVIVVLEPDRGDIAVELKDAAPDSGVLTLLWIGDDLAAEAAVGRDKRSKNAGGGDARGGGGDGLSSGAGAVACFEADALVGRDRRPKDSAVYVVPDPSDEGVAAASLDAGETAVLTDAAADGFVPTLLSTCGDLTAEVAVGRDKRSTKEGGGDARGACGDGLSSDAGVVACLEADALVGRDRRSKDSVAFDVIVLGPDPRELTDAPPDGGVLTLLWIGKGLS